MHNRTGHTPKGKTLALIGVNLTILMTTLDVSIVNVALPNMAERFGVSFAMVQWVMVGYLLVITSLMFSVSRLGDMFGKKRLFLAGLALFTRASLLCGLAPGLGWLIGFRGLQGLGTVMAQALGAALIAEVVEPEELGRAMGWLGSTISMGLIAGPSLGGLLVGLVGWRAIFLVNVPLGLAALWIVIRNVPHSPAPEGRERFDVPGALMVFAALGCYALGMTMGQEHGFARVWVLALLAAGIGGMILFIRWEHRARHPMVDLELLRNPLLSLNLLMSFLVFVAMGCIYILPFFFKLVLGYGPSMIGLMLIVVPVCTGLVSPLAGRLSDKWSARGVCLFGLGMIITGALLVSTMDAGSTGLDFVLRVIPMGMGLGFFQSPNISAIMGQAPRHRLGVVSGLMNFSRTIGKTTGIPLQGAVFTAVVLAQAGLPAGAGFDAAPKEALAAAFSNAYRLVALLASVALVLAALSYRAERKARLREKQLEQEPSSRGDA